MVIKNTSVAVLLAFATAISAQTVSFSKAKPANDWEYEGRTNVSIDLRFTYPSAISFTVSSSRR